MNDEQAKEVFKDLLAADFAVAKLEAEVEELDPDRTASGVFDAVLLATASWWRESEEIHKRLHAMGIPMFVDICPEHPDNPPISLREDD